MISSFILIMFHLDLRTSPSRHRAPIPSSSLCDRIATEQYATQNETTSPSTQSSTALLSGLSRHLVIGRHIRRRIISRQLF
jgi:hypothetical protein